MSFTNQKPFVATEEQCRAPWGAVDNGVRFRCYLCGHKFVVGDTVRWVYGNSPSPGIRAYGNILTCVECDGPNIMERFARLMEEFEALADGRFWSFL